MADSSRENSASVSSYQRPGAVVSHWAHMRKNPYPTVGRVMRPPNPENRGNRPTAEENVPNRFELFLLGDGEKKVTEETDTRKSALHSPHLGTLHSPHPCYVSACPLDKDKIANDGLRPGIPSTSVFTFNKEDHTLGNMLRARLLQSPHVLFSGYKVPHPLFRWVARHRLGIPNGMKINQLILGIVNSSSVSRPIAPSPRVKPFSKHAKILSQILVC